MSTRDMTVLYRLVDEQDCSKSVCERESESLQEYQTSNSRVGCEQWWWQLVLKWLKTCYIYNEISMGGFKNSFPGTFYAEWVSWSKLDTELTSTITNWWTCLLWNYMTGGRRSARRLTVSQSVFVSVQRERCRILWEIYHALLFLPTPGIERCWVLPAVHFFDTQTNIPDGRAAARKIISEVFS